MSSIHMGLAIAMGSIHTVALTPDICPPTSFRNFVPSIREDVSGDTFFLDGEKVSWHKYAKYALDNHEKLKFKKYRDPYSMGVIYVADTKRDKVWQK